MFSKILLNNRAFSLWLFGLGLLVTIPSSGQEVIWVGGTDSFWHTPENWDMEVIPGIGDIARVDDDPGSNALVLLDNTPGGSNEIEVGQLHVDAGDEIRFNGRRLQITEEMVINDGLIQLDTSGGSDLQTSPSLAALMIAGTGTVALENQSCSITSGTLTIGAGQTVTGPRGTIYSSSGVFTNNGTIEARESGDIGNRINIGFPSSSMLVNNGTIRAIDQGNIAFNVPIVEGGVLEAINGSRLIFSQNTVRDATLITDSGTGSVLGQFEELSWENIDLQGFARPVEVTYIGDLQNTGLLQIVNEFNPNLVMQSDITLTGDGEINFPDGGPNVIGDFEFANDGNTLSGSGTFAPVSVTCTGVDIEPSDDFNNNTNTRETGVMEFRCPTILSDVLLQVEIEGNEQNDQAPNANIANTHQDANQFLRVINIEYDQINIFETLTLTGELMINVCVINDFVPEATDVFDVITADTFVGEELLNFNFPEVDGIIFDPQILNLPDPTTASNRDVVRIDIKLLGDVNQDDSVDLLDVAPFVVLISAGTFQLEADINRDGAVNLLDVAGFVALLSG